MNDLEFSLPTDFGIATYPPGASFGPRQMQDYEFVWMIEGDAEYRRGDRQIAAPQGALVLCRPGATDFFQWDRQRRTRHGYFHFQIMCLPSDWPLPDAWPLVCLPEGDDILRPLFRHLLAWNARQNSLQLRLTIAHLLVAFLSGEISAEQVVRPAWPDAVERAWNFIHRHLEENAAAHISLAELADAACITPEHLCRLFHAATGHTPLATVRLARLDRAATLLARSNYSIAEIAQICGFASPFHFSRRFSAAFGQPPSALRRSVQSGETPPLPRLLQR